MKSVVTGANGFLASNLVRHLLERGDNVAAVIHRNTDRLEELQRRHEGRLTFYTPRMLPDAVEGSKELYHLAGYFSTRNDLDTRKKLTEANIDASLAFYEQIAINAPDAQVVFASSFSVLDSSGSISPDSYYSATKSLMENPPEEIADRFSVLRLSDTYGPGDTRPKVHNLIRDALQRGEVFELKSPKDKRIVLTHTDDVADALMHTAQLRRPGVFNLLNNELSVTLERIGSELTRALGGRVEFASGWSAGSRIPFGYNLLPNWAPLHTDFSTLAATLTEGSVSTND